MSTAESPPLAPGTAARSTRARAIRRRVFERVADADASHRTVHAHEGVWQPWLDGVSIKVLREADGVLTYLLRMAPGAGLPAHRHPMDEECLVLEGTVRVGTAAPIGPGSYHLAHRGALHATIRSDTGATLWLRGAVPDADQLLE